MSVITEEITLSASIDPEAQVGTQKTYFVPEPVAGEKHEVVAFFGKGVKCTGEIWYEGNVQIDGQLEGTVHTKGTLVIGSQAQVKATIEAGTVVCKGTIYGNVIAREKVNLLNPGFIDGTITTPRFSVETGGMFKGKISMDEKSSDYL
ncbi:MAG: polymer-forming cytoskeletal protein [Nitrospirales bacterium]|nr:polymer-forming cytoskeletal protein [Nitrospirales bacterium]